MSNWTQWTSIGQSCLAVCLMSCYNEQTSVQNSAYHHLGDHPYITSVCFWLSGSPMGHGVEVERWLCNPRVSGSIPGDLEKLFIWMKIHGLTQKQTVTEL